MWMEHALKYAQAGTSTPNPHVGCCVVSAEDHEVGMGTSEPAGGKHAEVLALEGIGAKARGSTLYVTLEPCNHYGKTPPCTKAIIDAGVKRVVIGVRDPNPKAKGGIETLREAGIEVEVGVMGEQCANHLAQFLFAMTQKRPMVTVKVGMSMDGRIALPNGESQWITSEASREDAMRLREDVGCVLVGRKTAELDKARLTVRKQGTVPRQPTRVVLDPQNRLAKDLPVFNNDAPTVHWNKPVVIPALLRELFERGETGVLVEGGATTISSFIKAGLVDRIVIYMAPKIIGHGLTWVEDYGVKAIGDLEEWILADVNYQIISAPVQQFKHLGSKSGDVKIVYHSRNLHQFLASYTV